MANSNFDLEDDSTDSATYQLPPPLGPLTHSERLTAIENKLDEIIGILNNMALYEEMKSWL